MALRWLKPVNCEKQQNYMSWKEDAEKLMLQKKSARSDNDRKRFIKNKELTENKNEVDKEMVNTKNISIG